jgi:RHS repeat-associated protein
MGPSPLVVHFCAISRCRWFVGLVMAVCVFAGLAPLAAAETGSKSGFSASLTRPGLRLSGPVTGSAQRDVKVVRRVRGRRVQVQPWWSQPASWYFTRPPVRKLAAVVQGSITTDGTAVQVTIANAGDTAELSFACSVGDRVSALFTGTIEAADVSVVRPDGTSAASGSWGFHSGVFIDVTSLNQTGTCLLRIVPANNFTGTETVQLWSVPADASYAIMPGGSPVTVTTTVPGQNASVTFTGSVGQRVSLRVDNVTTEAGAITITRPDGQQQTNGSWSFHSGTFIDATTLQLAGTYTIYVNPALQYTGSIQLTLFDVPPDASGTLVIGGTSQSFTTTTPGQNAYFTFSGTAGHPVNVVTSNVAIEAGNISILRPDGTQLASGSWSYHLPTSVSATLDATGTWKVIFDPVLDYTGAMSVGVSPQAYEPLVQTYGADDGGLDALNQTDSFDDVNTLSGAYTTQATDLSMPGIGITFNLSRSYTSADTMSGRLGPGWTDSYSASMAVQPNGDALVRNEHGQQLYYTKQTDGSFVGPQGTLASLTAISGGYQLLNNDQTKLTFDSNGRLTSIKDRNNEGVTLAYNGANLQSVTDSVNRVVTFTPNADGTLQKLTLPDGRHVDYGYTSGRLTSVTLPDPDGAGPLTSPVWTYGYDANGLLATVQNPNLHTIITNHYTNGRIDTQTDALNKQTLFSWDDPTQTETITDPNGHVWKDVYQNNILMKKIDPLGNTTTYAYDANDNLTSVQDARLNTTSMTYDAAHNMLTRTAPAPFSYVESWTYNSFNDPLTYTDGRGNGVTASCPAVHTTCYGYDTAGNLTSKTLPDPDGTGPLTAPVIGYGRDPAGTGLLFSQTDPNNRTTNYGYDSQGNLNAVTLPLGEKTTMVYDSVGRMTSRVDGRGNVTGCGCASQHTTSFGYDGEDHLTSETDPGLPAKTWTYDGAGNLTKVTDPKGHHVDYGYDNNERLSTVTAADGTSVTRYDYDNAGNLYHRTDPNNHATTYGYDNANRLTSISQPPITTPSAYTPVWTYGYDANGNRTTTLDPNGATATTTYDQLNRPSQISYSGGATTPTVNYSYDADSNRTQLTDGDGTATYGYDNDNRLTSVARTHNGGGTDTFSYGYDPAGNITSRTYPDGTAVSYSPDNDERLASMTVGGATTSYSYDEASNLKTTTLPSTNGYAETRTYDNANRLTEVKNAKVVGGSVLSDFVQTLDNAGNVLSVSRSGATTSTYNYGYDSRDRLTSVCFQASCPNSFDPQINWTYDSVGNRLTETRVNSTATGYATTAASTNTSTYNEADQLLQTVAQAANPYATQVEADGAGPYWRLGETGTSFASALGTYPGTWSFTNAGTTGALNGDSNKAAQLTSTTQTGSVANASGLNKSNNFTIELWIKRSRSGVTQAVLGKPLTTTTKSENYAIWIDSSNNVRFEVGNGTTSKTVTSTSIDTNWHYIAATFASGALKLYVDNRTPVTATATFTTAGTNSSALNVGLSGTSDFNGSLDEIAIYGTALTSTQISDHYSKGSTVPPANQTTNYSYDHNGNQTAAGTRSFNYDADNRLTSTTNGSTTDTYTYDGDDNRLTDVVGTSTTNSLWDSNAPLPELALERDGSNNLLRRYAYGVGISPVSITTPAGSFYYHYDSLRNIANLTDATGVTKWTYSYEPYGNTITAQSTTGAPSNPNLYNGQYLDTTGLYSLRARQYDPNSSRFLETDPKPGGANQPYEGTYDYAGENPVENYDPAGTTTCWYGPCPKPASRSQQIAYAKRLAAAALLILQNLNIPEPKAPYEIENIPGKGIILREPGTTGDANTIRIMIKGSHNPEGYVRIYNADRQAIDPRTGKPPPNVTKAEFENLTHVSLNYRGPWKGLPSFFGG